MNVYTKSEQFGVEFVNVILNINYMAIIHQQLSPGTKLKYIGKGFAQFDPNKPEMTFLGYDSNSWTDIWVDYDDTKVYISVYDVEVIS